MIAIGFDGTAFNIDAAHTRSQMDIDLAVPVKCLIMNQNVGLVRTIEKKALGKWRPVIRWSGFRAQNRDATLGACATQGFCGGRTRQTATKQQENDERDFVLAHLLSSLKITR